MDKSGNQGFLVQLHTDSVVGQVWVGRQIIPVGGAKRQPEHRPGRFFDNRPSQALWRDLFKPVESDIHPEGHAHRIG